MNKSKIDSLFQFKEFKRLLMRFIQLCFYHRRLKDPAHVLLNDLQSCRDWHELTCNISSCFPLPPPQTTRRDAPLQWADKRASEHKDLGARKKCRGKAKQHFPSLPICPYSGIYTPCHPSHTAHI